MAITMRQVVLCAVLMASAGVVYGGEAKNPGKQNDEAALRATDLAWSAAAGRKDLDAIVSFMADDGETLAPNEPAAKDKAAIRKSWANLIGLPDCVVGWEPLRVQVAKSGELGYTSGTYTLSFTDPKGQKVSDRGKYLEVWKKVDGKWKCLSDAYSSDIPLP